MGSKQSKRSVDISGKEGEAAGAAEVVAAGGEGRVEPIADVDTLKPQLNGDTQHIVPPEQISEKEKQLENGTPENEKDATTEKETVVTNGSGGEEDQPERENGDAKPTPEADTKKNKKEKVKKKWSLRSISFSRKDKPKQEKKQKEEEAKTNGETDKLPEEGPEASAVVESKSSDDVKEALEESKDEKTPDTPVTEPITNGSSAPETPKEEAPAKEASPAPSPVVETPAEQAKAPEEPEKLPLNGLPLEESKEEAPEVKIVEAVEIKAEETPAPAAAVPADIPATEVCVGQSPLTETTPPPLPANPPPSSLTAFAETTMAPHLVDASVTSQSESPLPITATAEIASSIVNVPLLSKVESKTCQSETVEINTPSNDAAIDTKAEPNETIERRPSMSENLPEEIIANGSVFLEAKEVQQDAAQAPLIESNVDQAEQSSETIEQSANEPIPTTIEAETLANAAHPSEESKIVSNDAVESKAQIDNLKDVNIETLNGTTNGDLAENTLSETDLVPTEGVDEIKTVSIESNLLQSAPIVVEVNSKDEETVRSVEIESPAEQKFAPLDTISNETIDAPSKPDSLPVASETSVQVMENGTQESAGNSPSEALPPPAQEECRGSNEEISESFPLPPSELCRSESEPSAAASPEPPQEATPAADATTEISVPEIIADKGLLAEIKEVERCVAEATSETVAVAAGAGDGAPRSD